MQHVAHPAAAESVWEGSRNVIRPARFNTDHLSYEQLSSYRRPEEETFNASDIPIRSSVSKSTTETPKKSYLGPESMPTFEEWVLQKPLGRQLLQDPPDVLDALCAAYRRHIAHMISLQGGSSTQKIVYSQEWRENAYKQQEADALSRPPHPAEDSAHAVRPSSAPSSHRCVCVCVPYTYCICMPYLFTVRVSWTFPCKNPQSTISACIIGRHSQIFKNTGIFMFAVQAKNLLVFRLCDSRTCMHEY